MAILTFFPKLYAKDPVSPFIALTQDFKCVENTDKCQECANSYGQINNKKSLQKLLLDAISKGLEDCVVHILRLDANPDYFSREEFLPTPLELAVLLNATYIVRLLIDAGANPDNPGLSGKLPVLHSVEKEHCHVIPLLFARGGTPNPVIVDPQGAKFSPFTLSAGQGCFECTRQLVQQGIDINKLIKNERPEFNGNTILIMGLVIKKLDYVRRIVKELGADTETRNSHGLSPLFVMIKSKDKEAIRVLVEELGADITAVDSYGRSSIDFAQHLGNEEIAVYLEETLWNQSWSYRLYRLYEKVAAMNGEELFVYTFNTSILALIPLSCVISCCKRC